MVRKTLLGAAAIIAVPMAIAGGYFLPHPPPDIVDPYDLPPPSIVEMPEEGVPPQPLKRVIPKAIETRTVVRA